MAVLVIDFLEAMQIENDQTEWLAVAAGAVQFFFESFTEQAAVVEAGERIGDGVQLQLLQLVVFDEDGNAKKSCGSKYVHKSRFQGDLPLHMLAEFTAQREHLIPELHALGFAKVEVGDGTEVALEELATRRYIQAFERVGKQLEIRILNRQTRGRRGAGTGHIRYTPELAYPRGVWGKHIWLSLSIRSKPGTNRNRSEAAPGLFGQTWIPG